VLGLLYLDLEPRAGKTSHPALYTLRAGASAARAALGAHDDALLFRHLPAAALVCDLPVPNGAGAEPSTGDALLRPRMLETLYHELGHALHALLARTQCQHFAGVRAPHSNSSDDDL
jgi:mitochondrial intermediate peptidase